MSLSLDTCRAHRNALLVDTNRGSYPLLHTLNIHSWNVTVIGSDPDAPLARLCANYINTDYSADDQLWRLAEESHFTAIIPGCTDASYRACASLPFAETYGFDKPEAVHQIFDKQALRSLARQHGIRQPAQMCESELLDVESILIKPVDGFSGAGITQLQRPSRSNLRTAIEYAQKASPTGQSLIEEFVVGQLFSHSAFLRDQEILHDFFVQEDCIDNRFAVDTSCMAFGLSRCIREQVRTDIETLAKKLQLKDGLIHAQFIERSGEAYLLEVTRRHPGDLYSLLIQYSTGFDYASHYLNAFLPDCIIPSDDGNVNRLIIRHTITAGHGCSLWSIRFHYPVLIRQWIPLASAGASLLPAPAGRVAILFIEAKDQDEQERIYRLLMTRSLYSFDH